MSKYNELVKKLKEVFQIDRPELDFGIYRILNARADEINDYLDNKLKAKIQSALADAGNANKANLEQQLQAAIKAATDAGFEPEKSPKVQELKSQLAAAASRANEHENAVFSHLLTFFSRYYDNGDFISKRRYKGDTYAVPYAGEEVMLHWANKDQYYIKSGENFANYSFKLDDGRKVSFKLLAADTAKDNRKDNDADRHFVLIEPHIRTKLDEDGEEYEQAYRAVEVVKTTELVNGESVENEELVIHFEYKAMKKGTKQDALVQAAITTILADSEVQQHWVELTKRAPTEKNPNRTELERHLTTYTQRNTADYFIHKDLGGFLSNELDFYIKNEVMNLDNVQNAEVFSNIEKQLRMIQSLRTVAKDLIAFLAQLENFQKKLWNKKKFVVSTNYLISMCLLSDDLRKVVLSCDAQWIEWERLGFIDSKVNRDSYIDNDWLIVDTSLFNEDFKSRVVSSIENVDSTLSGTLIHSDNYQALNLIREKYRNKADLIYIDPPYNTNSTPILYKNEYKRSSWASLMANRLELSMSLLSDNGVKAVAIDDSEVTNLSKIMESLSDEHRLTRVTVVHNPKGSITKDFNRTHEYCLFLTNENDKEAIGRTLEKNDTPRKMRRWGENSLRTERRLSFYPIYVRDGEVVGIGEVPHDDFHPEGKNVLKDDGVIEVWPIDQNGIERRWNFGLDSIEQNLSRVAVIEKSGEYDLFLTHEQSVPKTVWSGGEYDAGKWGNSLLISMLGEKRFDFPKSINLVKRCIEISTQNKKSPLIIDYFAGSGTTAHAVIEHNYSNTGNKLASFVVVEQGQYFETVTKPRVIKAAYSSEWKNGKALTPRRDFKFFAKVLKLESYEDALNNINLIKSQSTSDLFSMLDSDANEDYLINYMLDFESKESLINASSFRNPFKYEMEISTDSAGATERKNIDLVETFNYLIGLHIKSIESNVERGYVRIEGTLPNGERTLVLWRDCDKISYDKLNDYANRFDLYAKEQTFDVIYINGDHNLPTAFTVDDEDGEVMRSLKLRQIEPEFLDLMFAEEA
ncbi:DNA methyltransferase [Vibrio cholerae]|uniref:DNA methyltransferase n=1 Tax=Vibrio cholerae TaxID=666 RepID=UPI0027393413|nr:DNA methyltransferase [Vibrio cholerae]MDP4496308.1 DNA methyltransferase [Vibrio cholerae]WLP80737.1 DNA methyltransferase [Vibrio cholerae]